MLGALRPTGGNLVSRRQNATLSQIAVDRLVREVGDLTRRAPKETEGPGHCNETETRFLEALAQKRPGAASFRAGWPDFLIEHEGKFLAVEVKQGPDRVRPRQAVMFEALDRAGIPVFVWNPKRPDVLVHWRRYRHRLRSKLFADNDTG